MITQMLGAQVFKSCSPIAQCPTTQRLREIKRFDWRAAGRVPGADSTEKSHVIAAAIDEVAASNAVLEPLYGAVPEAGHDVSHVLDDAARLAVCVLERCCADIRVRVAAYLCRDLELTPGLDRFLDEHLFGRCFPPMPCTRNLAPE